jgi:hypothetical protein
MSMGFDVDLSGSATAEEGDLPEGVQAGSLQGDDGSQQATPEEEETIAAAAARLQQATPEEEEEIAAIAAEEEEPPEQPDDESGEPEAKVHPLAALMGDDEKDSEGEGEQEEGQPETRPEQPKPDKLGGVPPSEPPDNPEGDGREQAPSTASPSPAPEPEKPKRQRRKKATGAKPKKAPAKQTANANQVSGSVDRLYLIFQMCPSEVEGQIMDVPVRRQFEVEVEGGGTEIRDGIVARNRDLALMRAAKIFGEGFDGHLVAVPEGMWTPKHVINKPKNAFSTEIS